MAWALFVAALALRLLVDMATPLLPGAYHFNAAESIEAHPTASVSPTQSLTRATALPRVVADEVVTPRPEIRRPTVPETGPPRFRPVLTRLEPDRTPPTTDDH